MKKVLSIMVSLVFISVMAFSFSVNAFAAGRNDIWTVGWTSEEKEEYLGYVGKGVFTLDTNTFYGDSGCSIRSSHPTAYTNTQVSKFIETKPNTTYKFSAMVKYSGYELDPEAEREDSGAFLYVTSKYNGVNYKQGESSVTSSGEWTKLELIFTTSKYEDEKYYLKLCDGAYNAKCKGTAYFSDIKFEVAEYTNNWNALAVIFRNIDTEVQLNGMNTTLKPEDEGLTHFTASFTDKDIEDIKIFTDRLKDSLYDMSGGLVDMNSIEYVIVDEPLTDLTQRDDGYSVNYVAECVTKYIDPKLSEKTYQQILVVSPIRDIAGGWVGLGGTKYKGKVHICQINSVSFDLGYLPQGFPESGWVHEILHGVERDSRIINADKTAALHDGESVYKYERGTEWKEWYTDYMRCALPDGKGVVPEAFYRLSGDWMFVSDDMTTGNGIEILSPVSVFVDRLYTIILGRSAEPAGLKDWTNRLTSGTATSAEIVYGIANSQEFANRGLSNEDIVETMYQAMLGRPSDEGGKADWINCLNSGMTVTGIINGFSGSQEFAKICAEYGIQAGAITTCEARDRNNGLTLFVSRMYTKALNRPYDVAGLNDWTNRYLTGTAKVSDIAFGFIFSPEFVGKNLSDSDYVDTLYRTFFNREPDKDGKADWLNKLKSGTAREDVLNGFVGSQECINLVNSFGI